MMRSYFVWFPSLWEGLGEGLKRNQIFVSGGKCQGWT